MIGREAFLFQGWPITEVEPQPWITDQLLYGLAGNAVSCPVLLALLMATVSAVSVKHEEQEGSITRWTNDDEEDQEAALRLLADMTS